MGLKLISKGSVAPWNSTVIPAVTRGLEGWFTFDTDINDPVFATAAAERLIALLAERGEPAGD